MVTPYVEAAMNTKARLSTATLDVAQSACVSVYRGDGQSQPASGREVVGVHTTRTALLRLEKLLLLCQKASLTSGWRVHLIIDEVDKADEWMYLIIAVGMILHERGLVKLWLISATGDFENTAQTHIIRLGGQRYPVQVTRILIEDPDEWMDFATDFAKRIAKPGTITTVFVPGSQDANEMKEALVRAQHAGPSSVTDTCSVVVNYRGCSTQEENELRRAPDEKEKK